MRKAKIIGLIFSFVPLLLTSCSFHGAVKQYRSFDHVLAQKEGKEAPYFTFSSSLLDKQKNSETEYLLYIGSEGCGACQEFTPVLKEFYDKYQPLIYYLDSGKNYANLTYLQQICGEKWFNNEPISTPTLLVVHDNMEAINVPFTKMGNETMLSNYLKGKISFSNVYFTESNFDEKVFEYNCVCFELNLSDINQAKLYKDSIKEYAEKSNKMIVISDNVSNLQPSSFVVEGGIKQKNHTHSYDLVTEKDYIKTIL